MEKLFTLANMLTAIRILLIFPFLYFLFKGNAVFALVIFIIAILTDLEGHIARFLRQQTSFGAKFDLIADGLLELAIIIILVAFYYIYSLDAVFLIISKLFIAFGHIWVYKKKKHFPKMQSKKLGGILFFVITVSALLKFKYLGVIIWLTIIANLIIGIMIIRYGFKKH